MSTSTKYIVRMMIFVAKIIIAMGITAYLVWYCLFGAIAMSNVFIIATDGMKARADAVLLDRDAEVLEKFFTPQFLQADPVLNSDAYSVAKIATYDYDLVVKGVKVSPKSTEAVVKVQETIGNITPAKSQENPPPIPEWENSSYNIKLVKDDKNVWRIDALERTAGVESEKQDVVLIE